jgi:TPR repeat protein
MSFELKRVWKFRAGSPELLLKMGHGMPEAESNFRVVKLARVSGWCYDGEQGDGEGLHDVTMEVEDKIDIEEMRKLAEEGDAQAQVNMGIMYHNGDGVPEDHAEEARWYVKAAEQGDTLAMLFLGMMYSEGGCMPRDDKEAIRWYMKGAQQGDSDVQFDLGMMYWQGHGVAVDRVEAYKWILLAAAQGYRSATRKRWRMWWQMSFSQVARAKRLAREFKAGAKCPAGS